jgi:hypothetical protein
MITIDDFKKIIVDGSTIVQDAFLKGVEFGGRFITYVGNEVGPYLEKISTAAKDCLAFLAEKFKSLNLGEMNTRNQIIAIVAFGIVGVAIVAAVAIGYFGFGGAAPDGAEGDPDSASLAA